VPPTGRIADAGTGFPGPPGSVIVPIVMMGMMTRMMVSGNGKGAEGKNKTKEKAMKVKDRQDRVA